MSPRFYDKGEEPTKEFYYEGHGLHVRLNEDNLMGNFHEEMDEEYVITKSGDAGYDRVGVLDPSDEKYFTYWRFDVGDEQFNQLEYVVRRCGSFLVRQTVLPHIREQFESMHRATDTEFEAFLKGETGLEATDG